MKTLTLALALVGPALITACGGGGGGDDGGGRRGGTHINGQYAGSWHVVGTVTLDEPESAAAAAATVIGLEDLTLEFEWQRLGDEDEAIADAYWVTANALTTDPHPNPARSALISFVDQQSTPDRMYLGGLCYVPETDLTIDLSLFSAAVVSNQITANDFDVEQRFEAYAGNQIVVALDEDGEYDNQIAEGAILVCSGRIRFVGTRGATTVVEGIAAGSGGLRVADGVAVGTASAISFPEAERIQVRVALLGLDGRVGRRLDVTAPVVDGAFRARRILADGTELELAGRVSTAGTTIRLVEQRPDGSTIVASGALTGE